MSIKDIEQQYCNNCVFWKGDSATGRLPGVRAGYKRCSFKRQATSFQHYTAPTGWCNSWSPNEVEESSAEPVFKSRREEKSKP